MGYCQRHHRGWREDDERDEQFACVDCERAMAFNEREGDEDEEDEGGFDDDDDEDEDEGDEEYGNWRDD